jgi:membrane protease subunit (stomatin/prohibitin family)
MGILGFIKGQFIDVIDCFEESDDNVFWRFPMNGKDIMMNAQLIVRPAQNAIFVNEGQIADVFTPGTWTLTTQNMPVMTRLKSWKYGFESPFKADVFYVSTRQFTDQLWGTPSPLAINDPEFGGRILIQSRGQFAYRVADPARFLEEYAGSRESCSAQMLLGYLRGFIVQRLRDGIMESGLGYTALNTQLIEFSDKIMEGLAGKFTAIGLELTSFVIQEMELPENLRNAIGRGAEVNLMGGLNTIATLGALDAMKTAAANEGNPAAAMGGGVAMAAMMGQMFGQIGQNMQTGMAQQGTARQSAQPAQAGAPGTPCAACGATVPPGAKFCPDCGKPAVIPGSKCSTCGASVPAGAKFCPECGKPAGPSVCAKCGTALAQGVKFCPECGTVKG